MRRLPRWNALLSICVGVVLLSDSVQAQEKKKDEAPRAGSHEKIVYDTLRDVINHGADLYNSGDWNGCYRLWEGTLMTLRPLLSQHAELQQTIDTALVNARQDPFLYRRAWVLRTALDQIRAELKGESKGGKAKTKAATGTSEAKQNTLWERLGGETGVTRIVDDFVNLATTDPKVDFFRHNQYKSSADQVVKMKRELVEQISQATGGTLRYKGPDMKQIHKDMGITDAQFDAAAADLKKALEKNHVAGSDVRTILDAVNNFRKDVVQPKKTPEKKQDEMKPETKKTPEKKTDARQSAPGAKVSGRVTYKGQPVPGGTITLVGKKEGDKQKANLAEDGSYMLPSVPPGDYRVIVETESVRPAKGPKGVKATKRYVMIPAKYADATKSPMRVSIRSGENEFNVDLAD